MRAAAIELQATRVDNLVSTALAGSVAGSSVLEAQAIIQGPPDNGTVTM